MNITLMIIVLTFVLTSTILLYAYDVYLTYSKIKKFVKNIKPQIKKATTMSDLLNLDTVVSDFALIKNSFKLKSFMYFEAKLLLISINSKIELLDKLKLE